MLYSRYQRQLLKLTRFSPIELFTTLLSNDTNIFTITNSTIINNIISIVSSIININNLLHYYISESVLDSVLFVSVIKLLTFLFDTGQ